MQFCLKLCGAAALAVMATASSAAESSAIAKSVVKIDRRTGRLVRVVVPAPGARPAPGTPQAESLIEAIDAAARQHALDPALVHSVIETESNYNPFALSPKGAEGLMQLMPSTARRFGVGNSFNFAENLQGGVRYLRYLLDLFRNEQLAVAAYNAGEKAVIRYGGVPPYKETRDYVRKVTSRYEIKRQAASDTASASRPQEPEYRPVEWAVDPEGNLLIFTR